MKKRLLRLVLLDGITLYEEAHTLQRGTVSRRIANEVPDTLIMLEHPPVITLGHNANADNVLAEPKILKKNKISGETPPSCHTLSRNLVFFCFFRFFYRVLRSLCLGGVEF